MPIPLLALAAVAIKAVVAKAAVAKTIAVAAKGSAILAKAAAGHGAVVAKSVALATKTYGATTVISAGAVLAVSVGAAAIIIEKSKRVQSEIENGRTTGALVAVASLLSELKGLGGLDDVRSTLESFVSSSGTSHLSEVAEKTSALLTAMEARIKAT
jgi:hypothetical protein